VLVGGNELGVRSAVARLERELGQAGEVRANRAKGRAVAFVRDGGPGPHPPGAGEIEITAGGDRFRVASAPGVFSADALDPGSRLLLDHFDRIDDAHRVLDPGCGVGVLGLAVLRRFATARAVLADADARAVAVARRNAAALGLGDRCTVHWWTAASGATAARTCDLVVCNPPFHRGVRVDLATARAVLRAAGEALAPGGLALVVALRTLPFERELAALGPLEQLADRDGYKLLLVRRAA
jgi:16S rRNA (guanine1207-N2)-methyltransferase